MKKLNLFYKKITLIMLPLILLLTLAVFYKKFVLHAIASNVILNSIIIVTSLFGVLLIIKNLFLIKKAWEIIEFITINNDEIVIAKTLSFNKLPVYRLIEYIKKLKKPVFISETERININEEIESINNFFNGRQESIQFLIGLMIALGLLGTFIGLLDTLVSVSKLIEQFGAIQSTTGVDKAITTLVSSLRNPLISMGIAFSASMFGLITSLMLGMMILSVRSYQMEFYQFSKQVIDVFLNKANESNFNMEKDDYFENTNSFSNKLDEQQTLQLKLHDDLNKVYSIICKNENRFSEILSLTSYIPDFFNQYSVFENKKASYLEVIPSIKLIIDNLNKTNEQSNNAFLAILNSITNDLNRYNSKIEDLTTDLTLQINDLKIQYIEKNNKSMENNIHQINDVVIELTNSFRVLLKEIIGNDKNNLLVESQKLNFESINFLFSKIENYMINQDQHSKNNSILLSEVLTLIPKINSQINDEQDKIIQKYSSKIGAEIISASDRIEKEIKLGVQAYLSINNQFVDAVGKDKV